MIEIAKKILKDIFTGIDGETHIFAKYAWAGSSAAVMAAMAYHELNHNPVDLVASATALGIIATTHGAVIWGTKSTEPPMTKEEK